MHLFQKQYIVLQEWLGFHAEGSSISTILTIAYKAFIDTVFCFRILHSLLSLFTALIISFKHECRCLFFTLGLYYLSFFDVLSQTNNEYLFKRFTLDTFT